MLTKLSQWVPIWFCLLLHRFLSESRDIKCYVKPRRSSLFDISFRTLDYVIISHQALLSKTTKHWDGFVSHCMSQISGHDPIASCQLISSKFIHFPHPWIYPLNIFYFKLEKMVPNSYLIPSAPGSMFRDLHMPFPSIPLAKPWHNAFPLCSLLDIPKLRVSTHWLSPIRTHHPPIIFPCPLLLAIPDPYPSAPISAITVPIIFPPPFVSHPWSLSISAYHLLTVSYSKLPSAISSLTFSVY